MSNDLLFVLGLITGALSMPSLVGAFAESRPPRAAIILIVIGGGLVAYVVNQQPNTYTIEAIPDVFSRVIADIIR